jgi:hypothetical protein
MDPAPLTAARARHTPGPWRVDPCYKADVQTADGCIEICTVDGDGANYSTGAPHGLYTPSRSSALANARLIAAAPELLEALRELADAFSCEITFEGVKQPEDPAIVKARAAIAKATGEGA